MGLNELVLKVPASEVTSRPPQPQNNHPTSNSNSSTNPKSSIRRKSIQKSKTHSRESSGASNLSVKFSVSDETASVSTASNSRLRRNSAEEAEEEDLTLSDRLSHEDLEMDDGFHQGSKSCESIPQDRLTPDSEDDDDDRGGGR